LNYTSISENIVAAIVSAIVIAGGALAISWVRNILLERKLKDALNPNGVGIGFDPVTYKATFSLQVHNYSNATIRVRSIVLITDKFHVEFHPSKDKPIYQTPLSNEVTRPKFSRKHLSKGSLEPDNNPNAMLLPSKTMGVWEVESETIGSREWIVNEIFMAFEYATIFGNSALVRMKATKATLGLVKENFERLSKAAHLKEPFDMFYGLNRGAKSLTHHSSGTG